MVMENDKKPRRGLLLIALSIFIVEYLGIIGYYWLFGGHSGDATLTISRYVGLNPITCAIFCVCNLAIATLMICHLAMLEKMHGILWRFLLYGFLASFVALSVSPHLPEGGTSTEIHLFFAGAMFVIMALVGLLGIVNNDRKLPLVISILFTIFALFFIICDVTRVQWFMDGILWYESAYILAFFALIMF